MTVEETRERLLATAADVFGRLGYDGASIALITAESGLSSGAIYANFASKAELFVATLRAHAEDEFDRLLGGDSTGDMAAFLSARGQTLDRRTSAERTLLVEAMVAAKRHPEVAEILTMAMGARERQLTDMFHAAQVIGELDPSLSPRAAVRFALMVAMGSVVVGALDLPAVEHDEWTVLVDRLIDNLRCPPGDGTSV